MALSHWALAPGSEVLPVFMKLPQQSMLLDLPFHWFFKGSWFEISWMVEKFNPMSPTLSHSLITKNP